MPENKSAPELPKWSPSEWLKNYATELGSVGVIVFLLSVFFDSIALASDWRLSCYIVAAALLFLCQGVVILQKRDSIRKREEMERMRAAFGEHVTANREEMRQAQENIRSGLDAKLKEMGSIKQKSEATMEVLKATLELISRNTDTQSKLLSYIERVEKRIDQLEDVLINRGPVIPFTMNPFVKTLDVDSFSKPIKFTLDMNSPGKTLPGVVPDKDK